ncbi:alpha-1,3-mannosyl-glycoprotein 4-beta-N-acetylglucosaminyltransferase B-like isoform X1 [Clavelina lepadiformis]|uniref:alpha-1,3-mannosyl-glycoprotein 4-beta-N-acetylglucosaminyltransferase B-like isoform X1 n=2 Tax=Clavelina lepadiformis TaxID=159417 RepID=UPI004041C6FF
MSYRRRCVCKALLVAGAFVLANYLLLSYSTEGTTGTRNYRKSTLAAIEESSKRQNQQAISVDKDAIDPKLASIMAMVNDANFTKTAESISWKFGENISKSYPPESDAASELSAIIDYAEPRAVLGITRKKPELLLGIPSISRKTHDYLLTTLEFLLHDLSPEFRNRTVFLVYIADENLEVSRQRAMSVYFMFKGEVESGLLKLISTPKELKPSWESKLFPNFGDTMTRVKWRSKQNLDMRFLLNHAIRHHDPEYFLMMEDDVTPVKNYADEILKFAKSAPTSEWSYCDFTSKVWGAGNLFHRDSTRHLALLIEMLWNAKPLDWLLWDLVRGKMCGYSGTEQQCKEKSNKLIRKYSRDLFEHRGKESSRSAVGLKN